MTTSHTLRLKPGRDKAVRRNHPWIFNGAVAKMPKGCSPGDIIDVTDHKGAWLARGTCNPSSKLPVRLMTWNPQEDITPELVAGRLKDAIARRPDIPARRLVHMEADGLPGLIVDQYHDVVVIQNSSPLMDRWQQTLVDTLVETLGPKTIYERSDKEVRKREGLTERRGLVWGQEPPQEVEMVEGDGQHQGTLLVDVRAGQKTGYFLDQRVNRWLVAAHCQGKEVLNCFSYTGGFSIAAVQSGAKLAVNVDVSADALATAERMAKLNGLPEGSMVNHRADVFEDLRKRLKEGQRWDVIILDPPKFARSKGGLDRACRGYKDINMLAMKLLKPGGVLATFSCSGLVTPQLFQSVVAGAAVDARRQARILQKLSQPLDHPILLSFPEAEYLKGLICRVD